MLKSTGVILVIAFIASLALAEPPTRVSSSESTEIHHHHHHPQQQQPQLQQQGNVKIRQSGPSKIFGWIGSRFAKIPHYLPRFPNLPKHVIHHHQSQHQHQQPQKYNQWQATIVMPEPPKLSSPVKHQKPEKVKIIQHQHHQEQQVYLAPQPQIQQLQIQPVQQTIQYQPAQSFQTVQAQPLQQQYIHQTPQPQVQQQYVQAPNYHTVSPIQEIQGNSFALPVAAASSSSYNNVPESAQQIEVVPSTLLYHNKQVFGGQQQQQQQSYSHAQPIASPPLQQTYASFNAIPSAHVKSQVKLAQAYKAAVNNNNNNNINNNIPYVPQSTGPDYFDTAYRSPNQQYAQQYRAPQYQVQSIQSHGGEGNYGATFEIQGQGLPQIYDSPVTSLNPQANQALSSLIAAIPDSAGGNSYSAAASALNDYSATASSSPVVTYQQSAPAQQQQQQSHKSHQNSIPGVQILSQGTDAGNPVFEVLADANAPDYNGHPFDINKLISMIEPGAQLESAELSHAASETKSTYTAPLSASPAASGRSSEDVSSTAAPSSTTSSDEPRVSEDRLDDNDDGDLSFAESQVQSIAITVTPPPKHGYTPTTPTTTGTTKKSSERQGKTSKGKVSTSSISSSSSSSSSSSDGATATTTTSTTEKTNDITNSTIPSIQSIISSPIITAPTSKSSSSTSKNRPAPVYRKKTNN